MTSIHIFPRKKTEPVRLEKQNTTEQEVQEFITFIKHLVRRYAPYLLILSLLLNFVFLLSLVGPTESGLVYHHLYGGI